MRASTELAAYVILSVCVCMFLFAPFRWETCGRTIRISSGSNAGCVCGSATQRHRHAAPSLAFESPHSRVRFRGTSESSRVYRAQLESVQLLADGVLKD